MKRAIITGPTGAIGNALINVLIENGVEVIAVCRANSKRVANIPNSKLVRVVECDLCNLSMLPSLIEEKQDVFYHFAWDGTFGNARNNVEGQIRNIQYSLDAVEVASKLGCDTFVGAGSQAEYGRFEGKLNEQVPTFPDNGYGIAKLSAGQLSRIRCSQLGMKHIWTRILSIYGPYDSENTMIMSTIKKLLNGEKPSLTKGEQLWDYLFSADVGKAMYLLGDKGVSGKVYCLGSGETKKLADYVKILRDAIDPNLELGIGDLPYNDKQVMHLCADISDLRNDTGFEASFSFEEGIRITIDWCRGK